MILETLKAAADLGVRQEMHLDQRRSVRTFNILSMVAIPLPPIASLMASAGVVHVVPISLSIVTTLSYPLVLLLNHIYQYSKAKILFFTLSSILTLTHVYFFGSALQIEMTYMALLICAFAFSHNSKELLIYSFLAVFFYLICIYVNFSTVPVINVTGGILARAGIGLMIFSISFMLLWSIREQSNNHQKTILEVNRQLQSQNEQIQSKNAEIISTSEDLKRKDSAIMESLNYALRIQAMVLPSIDEIQKHFEESFIFYKPRNIVSGDFYWFLHFYSKSYFAIADCTGHGVPGAFLSMLGNSLLNSTVQSTFADSPRLILRYFDLHFTQVLSKGKGENREGMEIVLGVYDKKSRMLKVSSTNRPFILFRNGESTEYKGARTFIGRSPIEKVPFDEFVFETQPGDCFYFFTDGITDQFDATDKRKYTLQQLHGFLKDIHLLPADQQRNYVEKEFEVWRGETDQTDDMLLMGLKL